MKTDRQKYLASQQRYNQSEKGYERARRYEDSDRGCRIRTTYEIFHYWLVRRYRATDEFLSRIEDDEADELIPGTDAFLAERDEYRLRKRQETLAKSHEMLRFRRAQEDLVAASRRQAGG